MILLTSCNITKHLETSKQEVEDNKVEMVETTDKNTVKYITITEYQTVYDTITKEYPVKSITHIKEENKDKVTNTTNSEQHKESDEQTIEDKETKSSVSGYIWCLVIGFIIGVVLVILISLIVWYVKNRTKL